MYQTILRAACIASLFLLYNTTAISQTETPKYEVGAQFSMIRFSDLDLDHGVTEPGFGGRFSFNINRHLAAEAEMNFFPRERHVEQTIIGFGGDVLQGGRKTEGLFGVKAGARRGKLGFFGKARPGFVHFSHFQAEGTICILQFPPSCTPRPDRVFSETDFALDLGGVVEIYPSRRALLRSTSEIPSSIPVQGK